MEYVYPCVHIWWMVWGVWKSGSGVRVQTCAYMVDGRCCLEEWVWCACEHTCAYVVEGMVSGGVTVCVYTCVNI